MESRNDLVRKIEDLEAEVEELRRLLELNSGEWEEDTTFERRQAITELLWKMDISANLKGYSYIRQAILLGIADSEYLESVTKKLYPKVAEMFNTEPLRVERAIRHAIEKNWDTGIKPTLIELKMVSKDRIAKPTNSEFLALLTDWYNISQK